MLTRAASTAIVLHNDTRTEHMPGGVRATTYRHIAEDARHRAKLTAFVLDHAAVAFEEGYRLASEGFLKPALDALDWQTRANVRDFARPSYTDIRNYLRGEIEADEVLACRVAMRRTDWANRFLVNVRHPAGERIACGGERFWL